MPDAKYCYQNTDVLINKLDIKDSNKLMKFERKLTMLRLDELFQNPVRGDFDLKHLQNIHKFIFQDLYSWAGEIRVVDIAKGNMFCNALFIEEQANLIFSNLKKENYLTGLTQEAFIKRLAYYFAEINALHPFREGNGRTQREFIRLLGLKNNYFIRFSSVSRDEMISASKKSFLLDYTEMEEIFKKCVESA